MNQSIYQAIRAHSSWPIHIKRKKEKKKRAHTMTVMGQGHHILRSVSDPVYPVYGLVSNCSSLIHIMSILTTNQSISRFCLLQINLFGHWCYMF